MFKLWSVGFSENMPNNHCMVKLCTFFNIGYRVPALCLPALISGLKENLEKGEQIEHQVLASMSLLNLSKNLGQ